LKPPHVGVLVLIACTAVAAQQPSFRSGVKLVEATVVVHDRSGQPVADLKASDFRIFEDGKEQKIEFFAVDGAVSTDQSVRSFPLPPNVFTNRAEPRTGGGVTVILFDRLNSTFEDQKRARDQILNYIVKLQAGDRVAFYVLESDAITVLHDFTSDTARLIAAVKKYVGTTSIELDRSQEEKQTMPSTGIASVDAETEAWLQHTMEVVQEAYLRRRAQLTTDALEGIANHLAGTPGRKSLIWVSGAFPFVIPDPLMGPQVMSQPVNRATRAVNAADIAIYPVDIRGLMGAFVNPATVSATVERSARPVSGQQAGQQFTSLATVAPNQDSMRDVAAKTGGRVFVNTNAIGDAVRRAMDDSRVSYVLGYYAPRTDDKFHEIDVKVNRGGLDVRHRKGYLALSPPTPADAKARLIALDRVMQSPVAASSVELMAQVDRTAEDEAAIRIRIHPDSLTWVQQKDVREGAIDIVIAQSEPDGKFYKVKETTVNLSADAERYQTMQAEGFTLSSTVKLRPAAYRLHVIVSDVASRAVGSLIVPLQR
jgi:VWFA-related protein